MDEFSMIVNSNGQMNNALCQWFFLICFLIAKRSLWGYQLSAQCVRPASGVHNSSYEWLIIRYWVRFIHKVGFLVLLISHQGYHVWPGCMPSLAISHSPRPGLMAWSYAAPEFPTGQLIRGETPHGLFIGEHFIHPSINTPGGENHLVVDLIWLEVPPVIIPY